MQKLSEESATATATVVGSSAIPDVRSVRIDPTRLRIYAAVRMALLVDRGVVCEAEKAKSSSALRA